MSSSSCAALAHPVTTTTSTAANNFNSTTRLLHPYRHRCGLSRRDLATKGIVAAGASVIPSTLVSQPAQGLERLPFKKDGYKFWTWRGHKIHYVEEGEDKGIELLSVYQSKGLLNGPFELEQLVRSLFKSDKDFFVERKKKIALSYPKANEHFVHPLYNIPELAKKYKVYAVDLLGFGWSEKALVEYDALVWRDQVADFLKEIVKEPTILVGNSLGGFTALVAAEAMPKQVVGIALLNSAGQFGSPDDSTTETEESPLQKFFIKPLKEVFQRVVLGFLFWQAKQPARIESVLKSVYKNTANVDDYLIESITTPADDPNAGEVYYRLMTRFMSNQRKYTLDSVLSKLSCPLLLVWGDLDPWVGPAKAIRIKEFYPNTSIVNLQAGHCPHDEVPELVNKALVDWLSTLPSTSTASQTV
ncbi:hypothetical protein OSB04_007153 [Centaurea solstitialis]|uniref:AB hydrolase-1 domain-containing protein n=1 Tax=Centaurea solstitialis TaxID=347529 RepID=A0AA38TRZ9_9ASTR|nr:hypothetical protein OSB04_007153 [Centaurea solstitialis]